MALENKLRIGNSAELAREEEKIRTVNISKGSFRFATVDVFGSGTSKY